jgi:hypothetical protein
MSGFTAVLGTWAGSADFRPDLVFAPVFSCVPPPQADSSGTIAAAPATDAAVPMKVLRFS